MKAQAISIQFQGIDFSLAAQYREGGSDLIFFIHGLGCGKESFDAAWDIPAFDRFSMLAFDLPGFSDSSRPEEFSYTMEDYADICNELLKRFPGKKIHIVAHSMGGAVGLLLAGKIETRLVSFINVEGNLYRSDCGLSKKVSVVSYERFKRLLFSRMQTMNPASEEPGARLWAELIAKSDPAAFYRSSKSLVDWTCSGKLLALFYELDCNKIYIYGEKNSFLDVVKLLQGVKKIPIPGCGHFPMNDNPEEFYRVVGEALGKESSRFEV
ncbi:MAG: alpha/beta hydrolase [bacterium]|nr:alpha/beta hydrolase [bacterium]